MLASRTMQSVARACARPSAISRSYSAVRVVAAAAKAGDKLPAATVWEKNPGTSMKLTDIFKGKKGILVAVPGAFTPTCSETHLPSYIELYDQLKAKGAEVIAVISVNDAFVMNAWGKQTGGAEKGIRFLADQQLEVAKGLGMEFDLTAALGNVRLKRFSAIINDNKITHFNLEDDTNVNSYAQKALTQL